MHNTIELFIKYFDENLKYSEILNNELFIKSYYIETVCKCQDILTNQILCQSITELANKYNSDKGYLNLENNKFLWIPHTYDTIYYDLFIHCKDSIKLVFECGVGSGNKKYSANMGANATPGASLRAWQNFLAKQQSMVLTLIQKFCLQNKE
jgi:hypothetical protein